jgi:hypothetical protein
MSEPALYGLLTFHVSNLIPLFLSLGRLSKKSVQVRGPKSYFVTKIIFYGELSAPGPTPKLDHPLSTVRDCLFSIFAATPHIWRPFFSIRNPRMRHTVVGKQEEKRPLGRPWFGWEDIIKMDPREVEWGGMDWTDIAQDMDHWWAPVNTAMNLRVL